MLRISVEISILETRNFPPYCERCATLRWRRGDTNVQHMVRIPKKMHEHDRNGFFVKNWIFIHVWYSAPHWHERSAALRERREKKLNGEGKYPFSIRCWTICQIFLQSSSPQWCRPTRGKFKVFSIPAIPTYVSKLLTTVIFLLIPPIHFYSFFWSNARGIKEIAKTTKWLYGHKILIFWEYFNQILRFFSVRE
jgi:hypothetical protein